MSMLRYWLSDVALYLRLIAMQISSQAQYKLNLSLDIATYFFVTSCEFLGLVLFFIPFPTILGWSVGEVALLSAIISWSFGLAELIGAGFDNFAVMIQRGDFDRVLLRPVGTFIQIIGSDFRLRRLGRITQGTCVFVLALSWLPVLQWTPLKLYVVVAAVLSGAVIFISILILGATICFWTVDAVEITNILSYGSREMLSYPMTIYHPMMQRFFLFVVPVAFCSYVPACYLLGRTLPFGLPIELVFLSPLFALAFALVTVCAWRVGVEHYQSTGS